MIIRMYLCADVHMYVCACLSLSTCDECHGLQRATRKTLSVGQTVLNKISKVSQLIHTYLCVCVCVVAYDICMSMHFCARPKAINIGR